MGLGNDQSRRLLSRMAVNDKHGENSFHPTNSLHGVIQMGLAENQLCFDLIQEWMKNHPEASICTPEGLHHFRDVAIFQDYQGLPKFRKGVINFMSKVRGGMVKFDEDRVVMRGGATGANEVVMFCLADPGDAFLIPTPYYPAQFGRYSRFIIRRQEKVLMQKFATGRIIGTLTSCCMHSVRYQGIDQIGSCFSKHVFDPYGYDPSDFYDPIEADMRRDSKRKEQEKKKAQKVYFISGGTKGVTVAGVPRINLPVPASSAVTASASHLVPSTYK